MACIKVEMDRVLLAEIRLQAARIRLLQEHVVFIGSQVGLIDPDLDRVTGIVAQAAACLSPVE